MHESGNDRVAAKSLSLCELGQYTEAAELLEQHKMYARAAAAWRLANDPARAGGALERAGDLMGSLKIYEKADMTKQAASVRARLEVVAGNHYEAALLFSTAGQYKTALDHARRANRADAAATIYEAAGRPLTAAKQWIKLGKIEEAARAFTAGDKHMKAGACWQKLGNHVEMAHSLARAGKHFEAGTILQRAGELRLAVDYYEQVSGVSPHFEHAHLCRADALLALGDEYGAGTALEAGLMSAVPDQKNSMYFERWAQSLLKRGDAPRARRAMHKLLNAGFGNEARRTFMADVEKLVNETASTLGTGGRKAGAAEAPRQRRFANTPTGTANLSRRAGSARYTIKSVLGKGGMGEVFHAYDRLLGIDVALKRIMKGAIPDAMVRKVLMDEARMACRLDHPNIMKIYDVETEDEIQIAMEFIQGESLRDMLDRLNGRIPWADAMRYIEALCNALDYAHAAEIVHRDIKPDNCMITRDQNLKLLDFGIAQATDKSNVNMLVAGTPYYMSPEQCTPGSHIDGRTDVYAVGCMIFEFVVGLPPFVDGDILAQHRHTPIPDVNRLNPNATPGIGKVLQWVLTKDPKDRPKRAGDVWRVIESLHK